MHTVQLLDWTTHMEDLQNLVIDRNCLTLLKLGQQREDPHTPKTKKTLPYTSIELYYLLQLIPIHVIASHNICAHQIQVTTDTLNT